MNFWERGDFYNNNYGNRGCDTQGCNRADGYQNAGNQNCGNQNREMNCNQSGGNTYNSQSANNRNCTEQDIRQKYEQYSSKSEDQLMNELAQTVARMKSDGTFDPTTIQNMYNTAAPFLNDMQRQRMRSIIDALVR